MSSLNVSLLNALVYVTVDPAVPFSVTSRDSGRHHFLCPLLYTRLPPWPMLPSSPTRKLASSILFPSFTWPCWPFLGWIWRGAPPRPGTSLHPSEPHTQSQSKAKAVLRNFRSMRCLGMDKTQRLTYTCCLSYTLCYAPTSLCLKSTTPSVTEALPGTIKAGNERRGNQKEPQGLLGKETLF